MFENVYDSTFCTVHVMGVVFDTEPPKIILNSV